MQKLIEEKKIFIINMIGEKTGIEFNYSSISPSIFKHILIKDVSIKDYLTKEKIGNIKELKVEYNILSLIFRNYEDIIKYIKISDAYLKLDKNKNALLIEKVKHIVKKDEKDSKINIKEVKTNKFKVFFSNLKPLEILFDNVSFTIKDENEKGEGKAFNATISEGNVKIKEKNCYFSLSATSSYQTYNTSSLNDILQNISLTIDGDGEFEKDLSSAYCRTQLSANHSRIGKTETLSIFAHYDNDILKVSNLKRNIKNNFLLTWDINKKELNGKIKCNDFAPLSLFTFYNSKKEYAQFKLATISTDTSFFFNNKERWSFDTKLNINLPSFRIKNYNFGKLKFNAIADGKNGELNINSLKIIENRLEVLLNGKYNLNTKDTKGALNIARFTLPTNDVLKSNILFNGNKYSYKIDAPHTIIGNEVIKTLKCRVFPRDRKYNFLLQFQDDEGDYSFDGSLSLFASKFLSLHTTLDSVKAKTIASIVKMVVPKARGINEKTLNLLEDIHITTEAYISTDFKNYSYNLVQAILASTKKDSLYTTFQLNGNNSSLFVEKINVVANKVDLTGRVQAYFEKEGASLDIFLSINSIAYNISAIYIDKNLSIYGDYGITLNMFLKDDLLSGALVVNELPLPVVDALFSIDANFEISSLKKWSFDCNLLKLARGHEINQGYATYDLEMRGGGNNEKIEFNDIKLITNELPLMGKLNTQFDYSKQDEVKIIVTSSLQNETTQELFESNANFTLSDKFYFDGTAQLKDMALMRLFRSQTIRNKVSADIIFLGSIDNFFVKLELNTFNFSQSGKDLNIKGSFSADDKTIRIETCELSWGEHKIKDIEAKLEPFIAEGYLVLDYNGKLGLDNAKSKVELTYSGGNKSEIGKDSIFKSLSRLTSNFNIEAKFLDVEYGNKFSIDSLKAVLVKEPGVIAMSFGNNDEVYGVYLDDGTVSLHMDENLPVRCNIDGKVTNEAIDLNCLGLNIDMPLVWNLTPFVDKVIFTSGNIAGDIKILGTKKEPEFYSTLKAFSVCATSPFYAPEIYGPTDIDINLKGNVLTVPYTIVKGPHARLYASVTSEFSGWIPSETIVKCGTLKNDMGIMKTKNIAYHSEGYAGGDITMTITPGDFYLEGKVKFDNGFFSIPFNDLHKIGDASKGKTGMTFRMNLDVYLGKKAEYRWPNNEIPILRALVPSEKPIKLTVDSSIGYFDMKGSSTIRSGEVFYVKRSFYIKEGNINFVAKPQGFEPVVSLRAEIRDKDEGGEPIKIILTAKDQTLENFNPKLETYPPRSENAIMQMLGQVFIGNVSKENFLQTALTTATDLVTQIGVLKKTESKIRDFLHVDSFSMRTLLIQNAVFGNLFKSNTDTPLTVGNYFDNTSVYIGKYFGSNLYMDALLHLNYYDPLLTKGNVARKPVYGNLLFMPELGIEMATPFFLLRGSIAPTRSDTLFVSDTKLTFSWKFSY